MTNQEIDDLQKRAEKIRADALSAWERRESERADEAHTPEREDASEDPAVAEAMRLEREARDLYRRDSDGPAPMTTRSDSRRVSRRDADMGRVNG